MRSGRRTAGFHATEVSQRARRNSEIWCSRIRCQASPPALHFQAGGAHADAHRHSTSVTGEFHEVTNVSYDEKGRRKEEVTFAAQNSLRGIQLTSEDMEDIRVFMPLLLTAEDLPQYSLTYAGQQHVDDLDTYVFHVEPKKEEKDRRYFQGRIWIEAQDFQIVKACGKSGPIRFRKRGVSAPICIRNSLPIARRSTAITGFQRTPAPTTHCASSRAQCV